MNNIYYFQLKDYLKNSSKITEVNWFDLPRNICLQIKNSVKSQTINKLIKLHGRNIKLNKDVSGVQISSKKGILKIKFPINLNQREYVKLYALMVSEGSIKTEFSLNVPEKEFHQIFEDNLKKLISKEIIIKKDLNNNFERSRAPVIIRYLIPIQDHLPVMLFSNKDFAREYLNIVFEAEGCPIFNLDKHKKYIKLSRNSDISNLFKEDSFPQEERIFINKIKQNCFRGYLQLIKKPDSLILGEHLLLKYWFGINSTLKLESIRINKLGNRKGKVSAKWVLYIYSGEDIEKFNKEIGFISPRKRRMCKEMLDKIPSKRKQYFALEIMKKIQKENIFSAKNFGLEMKKIGYTTPQKFVWDYLKNKKIIEKTERGKYKILDKAYSIS